MYFIPAYRTCTDFFPRSILLRRGPYYSTFIPWSKELQFAEVWEELGHMRLSVSKTCVHTVSHSARQSKVGRKKQVNWDEEPRAGTNTFLHAITS